MARVIHYEDLALALEPDGKDSYTVHALGSPYGLSVAPFALSLRRPDLEAMLEEAGSSLWSSSARDLASPRSSPGWREPVRDLREIGGRLFRSLFHEAIREIYLLSKGRSESAPDQGLRIRLILPVEGADAALLQALPWELLYCRQTDDFLATNVLTPVVRQLAIPWASSSIRRHSEARPRILIAVAAPRGTESLDDADERARILQAWGRREGAEVDLLPSATLIGLREVLRSQHYQVLHFIGHGSLDAGSGTGRLLFETPSGEIDFVSGRLFADAIRESRELRLVFLNSCNSAATARHSGQDPLVGVAAAIVRRGVPAAIAMQFPVSDGAARAFSEAVYRSLARGSSLEAAVGDGRFAIRAHSESWEWLTPVLVTARSGSEIFEPLCAPPETSLSRPEENLSRIKALLATGSYQPARQVIEACLEKAPESADLHYYRALALLAGRRPNALKLEELKLVEASAASAVSAARLESPAAHHYLLLAFLYKDFYLENCLVAPAPGYPALVRSAAGSPMQPARLNELVRLAPGAKAVVDLVHG